MESSNAAFNLTRSTQALKHSLITTIFLFLMLSAPVHAGTASIKGTLSGLANTSLYLAKSSFWAKDPIIVETTKSDAKGNFSFQAEIEEEGFYFISSQRVLVSNLYLLDGCQLTIVGLRSRTGVTAEISGSQAEYSNAWIRVHDLLNQGQAVDRAFKRSAVSAQADFLTIWNRKIEEYLAKSRAIVDSYRIPESYKKRLQDWVRYKSSGFYFAYPHQHTRLANKSYRFEKPMEGYYAFLEELELNDKGLYNESGFLEFVYLYAQDFALREVMESKAVASLSTSKTFFQERAFDAIDKELSGRIRDACLAMIVKEHIDNAQDRRSYIRAQEMYKRYQDAKGPKYLTEDMASFYNEAMALAPGSVAPDFTFQDLSGAEVSLSDFRGKLVVIDFWGTWCGPCKRELPHSKKIEARYVDNEEIVFLFVAMERVDKGYWTKYVKENALPGVQLYSRSGQNQALDPYKIASVPRYAIIDKEGKFWDAYATRPSGRLYDQIRQAMAEQQ